MMMLSLARRRGWRLFRGTHLSQKLVPSGPGDGTFVGVVSPAEVMIEGVLGYFLYHVVLTYTSSFCLVWRLGMYDT